MKRRDKRCEHGFYKGLCPLLHCEHSDGKRTHAQRAQGIVHDAWGRGRRHPKKEKSIVTK